MRRYALAQQVDEFGLHVDVAIGDIEADDPHSAQVAAEVAGELAAVRSLHDEYEIDPVEMLGRQAFLGVGRQPCGCGLDSGIVGKDPLGCGRAQAVAAAEESIRRTDQPRMLK
jgi:hypothetical protein